MKIAHQRDKEKYQVLFCRCGWRAEPDIGMKNECPNCKKWLFFVYGTNEEIREYFNEDSNLEK